MSILDYITSSAVSLAVSGNTGINPVLTLFLVGVLEKYDPDLLHMDGTMETLLSSWTALIILGALSVLEFLSMCIPVVDEMVDSIMTFVIPVMSLLGSLSTFGLFHAIGDLADGQVDVQVQNDRHLSAAEGALTTLKVVLVVWGICLALAVHLVKMLVRLLGEGCLTGCLTLLEVSWTTTMLTFVIFVKELAIAVAAVFVISALFIIKRRFVDNKDDKKELAERKRQQREAVATATGPATPPVTAPNFVELASAPVEPTSEGGSKV